MKRDVKRGGWANQGALQLMETYGISLLTCCRLLIVLVDDEVVEVLDLDDDGGLLELMHVGRGRQHLMGDEGWEVSAARVCMCVYMCVHMYM